MNSEELTEKVSRLETRLGRAERQLIYSMERNVKMMDNMIMIQQNLNTLLDIVNPSDKKELLV